MPAIRRRNALEARPNLRVAMKRGEQLHVATKAARQDLIRSHAIPKQPGSSNGPVATWLVLDRFDTLPDRAARRPVT
jgi:hypothetical protein